MTSTMHTNQPGSSTPSSSTTRVAVAAWDSAAAPRTPPSEPPPPTVTSLRADWSWGWSWWLGIHYGPIPVGLIVGLPLLLALR